MPGSTIPRRTYQLIAVATLPLPFLATYALGRPVAALVPSTLDRPLPALYRLSERVGTVTDLEAMKEAISIF